MDPCKTSTITAITLTAMTVTLGESTNQNFAEAVDSAETTYGTDSCGSRVYTIVEQSDATLTPVSYARIETIVDNANYRIISDYTDETFEGTHSLALYITMLNYPIEAEGSHPTLLSNFDLTINAATCDCTLLDWVYPAGQTMTTTVLKDTPDTLTINHAVVDETTKATTPAIRACYRTDLGAAPGCDETTAITAVVIESSGILPGYMTMSGDVITVTPTTNT